ncbi:MAG: hypothetical protein J0H15_00725 [Xanthomonadales bacterium]|nr:hypothetical protein [Xanthomonadales bacterium]
MRLGECMDALATLDREDLDALQGVLDTCTRAVLDPAMWGWAFGITVACALVGALIGLARGRWLAGLLWGAVLGPIGWLVMLLSRPNRIECPACSRGNPPNVKACRHCGVNLQAAARASERAERKRLDSGRGWQ